LDAGVRVLNELIYECQRSLEGIEHARLDLDARERARARVVGGANVGGLINPPTDFDELLQPHGEWGFLHASPGTCGIARDSAIHDDIVYRRGIHKDVERSIKQTIARMACLVLKPLASLNKASDLS
jgi:hypothetical protein